MRWKPGHTLDEPAAEETNSSYVDNPDVYPVQQRPIGDWATFQIWMNEFDSQFEKPEFLDQFEDFVRIIRKAPGLSNIYAKDEILINFAWDDLKLCHQNGFVERGHIVSLEIINLYGMSRGREGMGIKEMNKTHQILETREKNAEQKKKGFFDKPKKEQDQGQVVMMQK